MCASPVALTWVNVLLRSTGAGALLGLWCEALGDGASSESMSIGWSGLPLGGVLPFESCELNPPLVEALLSEEYGLAWPKEPVVEPRSRCVGIVDQGLLLKGVISRADTDHFGLVTRALLSM